MSGFLKDVPPEKRTPFLKHLREIYNAATRRMWRASQSGDRKTLYSAIDTRNRARNYLKLRFGPRK